MLKIKGCSMEKSFSDADISCSIMQKLYKRAYTQAYNNYRIKNFSQKEHILAAELIGLMALKQHR